MEISPNASDEVIRVAYKALAKKYHPDSYKANDAEEIMKRINEAYAVLSDKEKREAYDGEYFNNTAEANNTYNQYKQQQEKETKYNQKESSGYNGEQHNTRQSYYAEEPGKKHKVLKLFITGAVIYYVIYCLFTPTAESEKPQSTNVVQGVSDSSMNIQETEPIKTGSKIPENTNLSVWSQEYLTYYIQNIPMELYDFSRETNDLQNKKDKVNPDKCYVQASTGLFTTSNAVTYKRVDRETEYIYTGQMKGDSPDGFGVVVKTTDIDRPQGKIVQQLVYEGMFKKGKYSGYGHKYFAFEDNRGAGEYTRYIYRASDMQQCVDEYFNELEYMGYFKDGLCDGKGIQVLYPSKSKTSEFMTRATMRADEDPNYYQLGFVSGDFKAGKETGKSKEYYDGSLVYDGEVKDSEMNGQGTLYYIGTDHVKYKGSFAHNKMEGQGTLYDYDGNVVCSGKWANNLCGIINANDYLSPVPFGPSWLQETSGENTDIGESQNSQSQAKVTEGNVQETITQDIYKSSYILPASSERNYTTAELENLSKEKLRLARNEIYAKHGRKFETADLNEYFNSQSWYKGYLSAEQFDDSVLNDYEKQNLDAIKIVENGISQSTTAEKNSYTNFEPGWIYGIYKSHNGMDATLEVGWYSDEDTTYFCVYGQGKGGSGEYTGDTISFDGNQTYTTINEEGASMTFIYNGYDQIVIQDNLALNFSGVYYKEENLSHDVS